MTEWYYKMGEDVQGPVSLEDLKHIFESGALSAETLVWCKGMQDWVVAMEISGRSKYFKPASSTLEDSMEASIRHSNQDVAAKKKRVNKQVFVGCLLLLVAASIFYLGHNIHTKRSSVADLSSVETSSTYPQNVQQPETTPSQAHDFAHTEEAVKTKSSTLPDFRDVETFLAAPKTIEKWIKLVANGPQDNDDSRSMAFGLLDELLNHMNPSVTVFPPPVRLSGVDPFKVQATLKNFQEQMKNIQGAEWNQYLQFSFSKGENIWGLTVYDKEENNGQAVVYGGDGFNFFFSPSAIDPSTGRIILKQGNLGETMYYAVFNTYNDRPSVIAYYKQPGTKSVLFNQLVVTDKIEFNCGFGPGQSEAEKMMAEFAAIIFAYGGQTDIDLRQH